MAAPWIPFGRVVRVNPARRELRVKIDAGRERFCEGLEWIQAVLGDGAQLQCRVTRTRAGDGSAIVDLAPGVTRDNVARMKGAALKIPAGDRAARDPGDYTVEELKSLRVLNRAGEELGAITVTYATGANAALEIARSDGTSFLVPAIPQVIDGIDWEQGVVVLGDIAPYMVDDAD